MASLDGGDYAWDPAIDYNGEARASIPDVGAFEYSSGGSGDITPPASPSGLTVN